MPAWLKVVLIVIVVAFVALFAVAFIGWRWVRANKDQLLAEGKALKTAGADYGRGKDARQCIDESLRRWAANRDFKGQVRVRLFAEGCMETAKPDPELCGSAPPPGEILASAKWANAECVRRGAADPPACSQLMLVAAKHCAAAASR
jgi:hypothetical protein